MAAPSNETEQEHAQHTPELAAVQTHGGSGGEHQAVGEPAGEELSKRLTRQNKAVARLMKDPANAGSDWHEPKNRRLPMMKTGGGGVFESAAVYPHIDADGDLMAKRLHGLPAGGRGLEWQDLYRAYKHTPHQPAAVYLKYLVHRINHLDEYEDPARAVGLDIGFLKHHQKGDAFEKNGHLVPQDFYVWMHAHPTMPEQLLAHKAKLHAELARGVGLNIRDIGGEKCVALSRGLNSDIMTDEHALSSWSDLVDPGFGKHKNHAWVPLKDLWYSYQFGPEDAQGQVGHENEYLVSHTAPRYEAEPHDVKSVRGHHDPIFYDNATDDELAPVVGGHGFLWSSILKLPGAGPKTAAAVQAETDPETFEHLALPTKFRTREQALASTLNSSAQNPNLTKDDLHTKVLQLSAANTLDSAATRAVLGHPNATADTARSTLSQYTPDRWHILMELAESPLSPPDVLDQVIARASEGLQMPLGRDVGPHAAALSHVLRNPNHTSQQADQVFRIFRDRGTLDASKAVQGRYSPQLIQELGDEVAAGYGQEPLSTNYIHGAGDRGFLSDLDKHLKARARFGEVYNSLVNMGGNRNLDDDSIEALLEAVQRHNMPEALKMMAARQNHAPMSEVSQLRLLRALDSAGSKETRVLAKAKGLAPSTVWALALHHDWDTRNNLYLNKTVDPELLAKAWPEGKGDPGEYAEQVYRDAPGDVFERKDPYYELANAIEDRRAHAKARQEVHLIRPWPRELAKSEGMWPLKLREWMSKRSKGVPGYYVRVPNLEQARAMVKERVIPVEPTDEVLDGYVVLADPADDSRYHAWEKDPEGGAALVYFETDSPPLRHEGRLYWPHEVVASDVRLAGIRPMNEQLQKSEVVDLKKMALLHDDYKRPRTVYRVENERGAGPYRGKYEQVSDRNSKLHAEYRPTPGDDFHGTPDYIRSTHTSRYAFARPEDAVEWFGSHKLKQMAREGYHLRAVPASKVWISNTGRQVIFEPHETAYRFDAQGRIAGNPVVEPPKVAGRDPNWSPLRAPSQQARDAVDAQHEAWELEYQKHLPKLTAAYNKMGPKEKARFEEWDTARHPQYVNDKALGVRSVPGDWTKFIKWARTVVPGAFQPMPLRKSEPLSRGPAFNGEKDYRPDEAGDPQFPFQGGPRKESFETEGLKLPGSDLEPGEHRTALAQLGHNDRFELVLAAACFLARKPFDDEKFRQGLAVYGDEVRAALHAVDLADSEKNMRAMGAVIRLQGGKAKALSKSEQPQPIGIHSIQPGNEDAIDAAESVERAVRSGTVVALKLNGKHSKGAMAARDPRSGRVWLLKPGSGKQSPAAGARDGKASQSRREAAFWHVADEVHLGGVVPRADLVMVNAQEWAAIKLLGSDWKSLDERNREKQYKGREVLGPYLASGQIHRWAILDWVLGNTDSHGQNLLVNEGGSVALIDHGAAFAGAGFDPAHDTKSFIPFYLRCWAPESDFKRKTPEERVKYMPTLGRHEDEVLKRWLVEDFAPEMVERVLRKYGIDEKVLQACLARLTELRSEPGNLSRAINALWAGARVPKPDETR